MRHPANETQFETLNKDFCSTRVEELIAEEERHLLYLFLFFSFRKWEEKW